ncbi:crossover junction endodeoxyribonuclease RuvC [Candidatus Omnitrophota bacterium]
MKILGVDPALTITGYGLISAQKKKISLIEAGIIKTSASYGLACRIERIYTGIRRLIIQTRPDVIVLEKLYAHYRHPATAFHLGHARGVIVLACAQEKVTLIEYGATRIKKAVVGRGLATKYQVQRMVAGMTGLKSLPKYTDVTDALALAIAHSHIVRAKGI